MRNSLPAVFILLLSTLSFGAAPLPMPQDTDTVLPPGAADDIAQRMAQRRAAQLSTQPGAGRGGFGGGGFGGFGGAAPVTFQPAPEPLPIISPASQPTPDGTLSLRYENVPLDAILQDFSNTFGYFIIREGEMRTRITLLAPDPLKADDAVRLLNTALRPLGFGSIITYTAAAADAKVILRIAPLSEIRRSNIPVRSSTDPALIPITDDLITQIMPLKNVSAVGLLNDLRPIMSSDADATASNVSNCIVVVDTAAKIHRIAEVISALDKAAADRPANLSGRGGTLRISDPSTPNFTVVDGAATNRRPDPAAQITSPRLDILAPAAGALLKVHVTSGQSVKAGDLLFELDSRAARALLQMAEAQLTAARAKLAAATSPSEAEVIKADVSACEANLTLQRLALDQLQIRAPFDGTIGPVTALPGQFLQPNSPLAPLVDTSTLSLTTRIAFADRTRIKVGGKLTFTVDKTAFPAEITFISPAADASNRAEVHARLTGPTDALMPGVTGTVTFSDAP